ncbi:MAG: hypothetical protein A4C66_10745 [Nitrospira sp. HN-bin3]|uniref:hypothetical protein n=1 Tax=Nitrospira cf. moscoviensis SBR1015 TaxID=96242 RepID=UPI000A0DE30B|nr:hypothetical protein [Nitrospira cf. moscoviensis SBR1015]OQW40304.1 MAG: hypothetical protein A4C66_10745 [Nitrospira sp. HN-bin3]
MAAFAAPLVKLIGNLFSGGGPKLSSQAKAIHDEGNKLADAIINGQMDPAAALAAIEDIERRHRAQSDYKPCGASQGSAQLTFGRDVFCDVFPALKQALAARQGAETKRTLLWTGAGVVLAGVAGFAVWRWGRK